MKLPTLYKKTSTGDTQTWEVETLNNKIITRFGKLNGKIQVNEEEIAKGKNIGKANETTNVAQAQLQAKSDWTGKLKRGYVESLEDAKEGKTDAVIEGGMFPMLAHKYSEQAHKIIFPALAQPKLDGHCCIAIKENGVWGLWSRTRKPITGVPHIIEALSRTNIDYILHGELYNHDYKNKFEELTHFIRQETPEPGHEIVEYHIYDVADPDLRQGQRIELLKSFELTDPLKFVFTCDVEDEDNLMDAFGEFIKAGYEGAMVRNRLASYVNKRSYDLLKVKEFEEKDFKIIRVEEGKGSMAGKAIFVCTTEEGSQFKAKMIGAMADLEKYVTDPSLAIGKMAEIKYQGFTNKSSVPRFPVCNRIKIDL